MGLIGKVAQRSFIDGLRESENIAVRLCPPARSLADMGAGDGVLKGRFARTSGAGKADTLDIDSGDDLNKPIACFDGGYDVIVSTQTIEHLYNPRLFLSECYRLLRPAGTIIITTENMASIHNIGALNLGWQPFSSCAINGRVYGNPACTHQGEHPAPMSHVTLFTPRALGDMLHVAGFSDIRIRTCGFAMLSGWMARLASWLDPTHSMFIVAKARRWDA